MSEEKVKNTRRAFILSKDHPVHGGLHYKEIPFLDVKKGDTFLIMEEDGTPVANYDGSVVCKALEDAEVYEGINRIKGLLITKTE